MTEKPQPQFVMNIVNIVYLLNIVAVIAAVVCLFGCVTDNQEKHSRAEMFGLWLATAIALVGFFFPIGVLAQAIVSVGSIVMIVSIFNEYRTMRLINKYSVIIHLALALICVLTLIYTASDDRLICSLLGIATLIFFCIALAEFFKRLMKKA